MEDPTRLRTHKRSTSRLFERRAVSNISRLKPVNPNISVSAPESPTDDINPFAAREAVFSIPDETEIQLTIRKSRSATITVPSIATPNSEYNIELWGYVILITTWSLFIWGMGSMLGIWSRVFSKSSTNQNFETLVYHHDDSGIPFSLYYPALLILIWVILWIWSLLSWIGMKFFRHAKGGYID